VYLSVHNNPINFVDPLGLKVRYETEDEYEQYHADRLSDISAELAKIEDKKGKSAETQRDRLNAQLYARA